MELFHMAESSHFREIATALWAVLYNFSNCQVADHQYRVERKFKDGQRVVIDLTLSYPADDIFCPSGCCNCEITITLEQAARGIEKFIRRLCWNVENVAAYRILSHREDPYVTILQLCERPRLEGRHQCVEDFLMSVAKVITKNIDRCF